MDSSIQVGVRGPTVWVKVEGKGSFLNSGNLKEFAREMLDRGYREFVVDLADCAMMDSTFMGTMASVALRLKEIGQGHLVKIVARSFSPGWVWIRYLIFMPTGRARLNMKRSSKVPKASCQRPKKRSRQKRCWRRTRRFARQHRKMCFDSRTFSIS